MNFVLENDSSADTEIPFFEDVKAVDGYAGMSTQKSIAKLKQEVSEAILGLGGTVYSFDPGYAGNRYGFQVRFNLLDGNNAKFEIVAFPLKTKPTAKNYATIKEKSLKTALYNLRDYFNAMWRTQKMMPGYFGLLPMLVLAGDKSIGEMWIEELDAQKILPANIKSNIVLDSEIVDGEFENE